MTITTTREDEKLTIAIEGKLDTVTAPELEKVIDSELKDVKELVFDMDKLEYTSSAGLRVILRAMKIMQTQGSMKLVNVCDEVYEVFDITGFVDIMNIEAK